MRSFFHIVILGDFMNIRKLLLSILPLLIGTFASFLTRNNMDLYATLQKPFLAPPGWVFFIVWTILYILMGFAYYLVSSRNDDEAKDIYLLQLFVNFFWSIIFFNFRQFLLAFIWLVILLILIVQMIKTFYNINHYASYLLIPYLIWVSFAGYLNIAIYLLN